MTLTPEPDIRRHHDPEDSLQKALRNEIERILNKMKSEGVLIDYFILDGFGLDLAVFIRRADGHGSIRLLELKSFVGSRQGGVGIGNQRGKGSQIDLLTLPKENTNLCDEFIRWILVDGTKPKSARRYAFFRTDKAKTSAMGTIQRGKQNNLRVRDLTRQSITWSELSERIEDFLHVHARASL